MIEGCKEKNIQPCSVDLSLGKIFRIKSNKIIDIEKNMPGVNEIKLPYVLKPEEYVLASSIEKVNQKHTKYAVLVVPRSRAFRIGLSIESGLLYPYYKGEVIFGIKNISENKIRLNKGMGLIQLCFFEIKSDFIPLHHTYQNGRVI